jgi:hypothetical protein
MADRAVATATIPSVPVTQRIFIDQNAKTSGPVIIGSGDVVQFTVQFPGPNMVCVIPFGDIRFSPAGPPDDCEPGGPRLMAVALGGGGTVKVGS